MTSRPLQLLFNSDALEPPLTGIGHYTQCLLQRLRVHPAVEAVEYIGSGAPAELTDTQPEPAAEAQPSTLKALLKPVVKATPGGYLAAKLARQALFEWRTRKMTGYLYHETNYIPRTFSLPFVTTVHDLSHVHYPQFHPAARVKWLEEKLTKTVERAEHIITVSESVRAELIRHFSLDPQRVSATLLGVESMFHPRSNDELAPILATWDLQPGGYILSVATIEPRKNIEALIQAYLQLSDAQRQRTPLVLVGDKGWRSEQTRSDIERLVSLGQLRYLGYVSRNELVNLYAGACGFAFPSLYEGFGLPPLEAMASGAPVLVSDRGAMAEVAADAGLKVDPEDVDSITAGLQVMLEDEQWREQAIAQGLQRAQQLSWDACVEKTLAIYHQVNSRLS